jgi:hypothetical protein
MRRKVYTAHIELRQLHTKGNLKANDPAEALLALTEQAVHSAQGLCCGPSTSSGVTYRANRAESDAAIEKRNALHIGAFRKAKLYDYYRGIVRDQALSIRETHAQLVDWWQRHPLHQLVLFVSTQAKTRMSLLTDGSTDGIASPTKKWSSFLVATLEGLDMLEIIEEHLTDRYLDIWREDTRELIDQAYLETYTRELSDEAIRISDDVQ